MLLPVIISQDGYNFTSQHIIRYCMLYLFKRKIVVWEIIIFTP